MKDKRRPFHVESTKTIRNGQRLWRVTDGNFSWIQDNVQEAMRSCDQLNADYAENLMAKVRKVA